MHRSYTVYTFVQAENLALWLLLPLETMALLTTTGENLLGQVSSFIIVTEEATGMPDGIDPLTIRTLASDTICR